MHGKILVGYDGSGSSRDALALAESFAQASDARVVIANVYERRRHEGRSSDHPQLEEDLREEGRNLVARAQSLAQTHESMSADRFETKVIGAGSPARGLHELAEELGADLLIVGASSQSRIGQALIGTTAQRLLHGSPCPVCLAPAGFGRSRRAATLTIAVGYDGSTEAELALASAWRAAADRGGRLRVLSVAEPPPLVDGNAPGAGQGYEEQKAATRKIVERELTEAVAGLPATVEIEGMLLRGEPATEICKVAADADLLFVGSRGYGPLGGVLTGTVSKAVIEASVCPVVISPRSVEADRDGEAALVAPTHEP